MVTKIKAITLDEWMQRASPAQRGMLYEAAQTSQSSAHQMAVGWRNVSPKKAAQIEAATLGINESYPALPPVLRTTLCLVCAECPFAKKCLEDAQ